MLYACSKCFSRHPYEELSQGKQLCKKCRGDFPTVKCTYCRSEFQQESKNKTSSICKRCEQCVAQYGKPTTCQFCQLPAAFVGGKCQRCSHYHKRYGPPKICEQCKQKSAFDKKDNSKLMCWACSCSYKRALAKTKQSDPARHSRVFKKEKKPMSEEDMKKKRERYMNSKKPNRPDVTKLEIEAAQTATSNKVVPSKKEIRDGDTDHVGEITQLKEKIAFLEKTIKQKENQLISKDKEITQMKAKLFNEEKLIREKMKTMSKLQEDKVTELNNKIRSLNNEISKMRKDSRNPNRGNKKQDNLFKDSRKRAISRNNSPVQPRSRSRSRSRSPAATNATANRSRSRSPQPENNHQRSPAGSARSSPSRSRSASPPAAKTARMDSPAPQEGGEDNQQQQQEGEGEAEQQVTGTNGQVAGDEGVREEGEEARVEEMEEDTPAPSSGGDADTSGEQNLENSRSSSPSGSEEEGQLGGKQNEDRDDSDEDD